MNNEINKQDNDIELLLNVSLNDNSNIPETDDNETENTNPILDIIDVDISLSKKGIDLLNTQVCDTPTEKLKMVLTDYKTIFRPLLKNGFMNTGDIEKNWFLFFDADFLKTGKQKITLKNVSYTDNTTQRIRNNFQQLIKSIIKMQGLAQGKTFSFIIRQNITNEATE